MGLSEEEVADVQQAALLHDVGKVGIPDTILKKRGRFGYEEWEVMREHPVIGERILLSIDGLAYLAPIVRATHERWDGQGYPDRLVAGAIPFDARVIAIVDAFDAMTSDRPYRPSMSRARALEIMRANAGPQWAPDLVEAFVRLIEADEPALTVSPPNV